MPDPLRVLYVDDDPGLLEIGKIFLEDLGGFSVITLDSADEALIRIGREQFDAVISDYEMPKMDGIRFLVLVRAKFGEVPFILFTGKGREEVVIQAINNGVDFYLQKGGAPDAQFAELAHKVRVAVERRANEEALKKSEEKYRRIVETASAGERLFRTLFHEMLNGFAVHQIVCDENGTPVDYRFIDVNPAFEQMTGLHRENVIGKTVLELMPETEPFWIERYGRVALTGFTDRFENYSSVLDKSFDVTVYQNAPGQFTTIISDITERKLAEDALRETGSLLSLALRSARAGTWYWDYPTGKQVWSPEFYTLFDLPPDAPPSFDTWLAALHPDDRRPAMEKIDQAVKEHRDLWNEYRILLPDGSWRWIGAAGSTSYDENGAPVRMSGVCIDINDQKQSAEALLESRRQLHAMAANVPGVVFRFYASPDGTTGFDYISERSLQVLGLENDTATFADRLIAGLTPEDRERYHCTILDAMKSRSLWEFESWYVKPSGKRIWISCISSPVMEKDRLLFDGVAFDITDRKRIEEELLEKNEELKASYEQIAASQEELRSNYDELSRHEQALRESEERFRALIQNSTDIIRIINAGGVIVYDSPSSTRILGYPPGFTIGKNPLDFIHPEDHKHVRDDLGEVYDGTNSGTPTEFRIRKADGSYIFVESIALNLIGTPGVDGIVITTRPIEERKKSEDTLKKSEERFRGITERISDLIIIADPEGRPTYISPSVHSILGFPPEYYIGVHANPEIFPEKDIMKIGLAMKRLKKGSPEEQVEFRMKKSDGTCAVFLGTGKPVLERGVYSGVQVVAHDITGNKQAEEALIKSQDQLAEAMDLAHMANWEFDVATGLFTFDDRFYALYGTTGLAEGGNQMPAEVYAKKFVHPDDQYMVAEEVRNAIQATDPGYVSEVEHRIIRRDGETRNIVVRFGITKDKNGATIKTHGANQDITERKQAEKRLYESENTFIAIFQGSPVALTLVSARDRKFVNVNDAFVQATGYTRDEVIGITSEALGIFADTQQRDQLAAALRDHGIVEDMEISCRIKTGEIHPCLFSSTMILIGGRPHILSTVRDITARKRVENALTESEERFRSAMNKLPGTAWVVDRDLRYLLSQGAGLSLIGLTPDEVVGMTLYEFFHTSDPSHPVISQHLRVLAGESVVYEYSHEGITFRTYLSPLHDHSGDIRGVTGLAFDITELKKAEDESRKKDSKFRILIEASTDVIWEVDLSGNFTYVSPQSLDLTGYSPAELIGKPMVNLATPDRVADLITLLATSIKEQKASRSLIVPMKHRDGRIIDLEIRSVVISDDNGEVQGFGGIALDITERNRMVESLRESEEKFRLIVENSHDIIYTLNADGVFMFVSPVWTTLLGHPVATVTGESFRKFVHPDDMPGCQVFLQSVIEGGKRLDGIEYRVQHLDGIWYWHTSSAVPFRDETGRIVGFYGIARDITERKMAEDALHLANRKLNLLSSITRHDINNQLSVLMGYLGILKKKPHDSTFNQYFQKASIAAERISSIIRFTKEYEEIGVRAPSWENCRTIVDSAAKEAPLGEVRVMNDLPPGIEVFADPLILKVFYNLMDNAVRHGEKITTVRFNVENAGEDHIIICEDDGKGVPAGEKEKIFECGFGKNTGLGLALSREILSITSITIRETGEPGKGARFEIAVPKGMYRLNDPGLQPDHLTG